MKHHFDTVSIKTSQYTTRLYSTSFSLGIKFLNQRFQNPIYAVYGFVRLGDEIVDTFHDYDQNKLMEEFKEDVYNAVNDKFSLNPILNSFQHVYHKYNMEQELVDLFIQSMEMDLDTKQHNSQSYKDYILGSAEVVGLMCLRIFCEGDKELYQELKPHAMSLGSAFQKINFLRDVKADFQTLGRTYFPGVDLNDFTDRAKIQIELDIEKDFAYGLEGIKKLPKDSRFGVYMAYRYFHGLFKKIKRTSPFYILQHRVRLSNFMKYMMFFRGYLRFKLNLI